MHQEMYQTNTIEKDIDLKSHHGEISGNKSNSGCRIDDKII